MRPADHSGRTFGKLVAINRVESDTRGQACWRCLCACGTYAVVPAARLLSGGARSCGCARREMLAQGRARLRHGHARKGRASAEYRIWTGLHTRCFNPKAQNYRHYGGRGITICARWESFENFLADMGPRPTPLHSIERKNNDGNYEPDNCAWATQSEQCKNRRRRVTSGDLKVSAVA